MKKNFRKTPEFIVKRINEFVTDNIEVATVIRIDKNDLNNEKLKNLNFTVNDDQISFTQEFVPSNLNGSFSRKNIDGYKIVHRDRDKIRKTYYLGERPIFGDWGKGSFSLYVTRSIFPYDNIPPRELTINTELIEQNDNSFTIKVSIGTILNRIDPNFEKDLFFAINLLQENVHSINVFSTDADIQEYLRTLSLAWEIFPPGERGDDLNRIFRGNRNLTPETIQRAEERYDYLVGLNPIEMISGLSGIRKYFGAKYSENLVVFENLNYGNAIYVLFENWEELSQLSRTEILNRPRDQYIRIKHTRNWESKLERIINNRR